MMFSLKELKAAKLFLSMKILKLKTEGIL